MNIVNLKIKEKVTNSYNLLKELLKVVNKTFTKTILFSANKALKFFTYRFNIDRIIDILN